jgi:Tfp pilus assembly protein PilE
VSEERRAELWRAAPTGVAIPKSVNTKNNPYVAATGVATPKFANRNEKAYIAAMKSDLRNMATYEEQYAADNHGAYFSGTATTAAALQGYTPSQNVTVVVTAVAGPRPSWSGIANHTQTSNACVKMTNGVITCTGEPSTQRTRPDIPAAVPQPRNQPPSALDASYSGTYFPVNPLPPGFEDFGYLVLFIKGPKIDGKVGQRRGIGVADRPLPMRNVRLNGKQFSFESIQQDGVGFAFAGEFVGPSYAIRLRGHLKRLSSGGVQEADVELFLRGPEAG